jgi:hypothetical protein
MSRVPDRKMSQISASGEELYAGISLVRLLYLDFMQGFVPSLVVLACAFFASSTHR